MTDRINVAPTMFRWARERSGRTADELERRGLPVGAWEAQTAHPTLRQLEAFANATHTSIGFFFLSQPPHEDVPLPDFRTVGTRKLERPSADLLDTIYACEQRQDWYRHFAEEAGEGPVGLVGSVAPGTEARAAASELRDRLAFGLDRRTEYSTWSAALGGLAEHAESLGVLVMISGIVGNNTHRVLNPDEFRGFAMADRIAPLVFVNGADTKAAQLFTLAHELGHIALGESAISNPQLGTLDDEGAGSEPWCNAVAAELLVPAASLKEAFQRNVNLTGELDRLAKYYKASTLVILRRLGDLGLISLANFKDTYPRELQRVIALTAQKQGGGNFYLTTPVRVSKRFARALIVDTLEGRTSYRDAFRLLGSKKLSSFEELSQRLGVG